MEVTSNIKGFFFKICFISLSCCVLLWFSIFSYGLLYYLYIPAIAHVKAVYLSYDSSCAKGKCKYPSDNITLVEKSHSELLSSGQAYAIEVLLDMPESERNLDLGMFMIQIHMLSENGAILKSSRRPALLHYRSPLFKVIYTLFYVPALLAGSVQEKQTMVVPLFEHYVEDSYQPTHFAYIHIEAPKIEIYSCKLRIHAQFTGLRYMMYYWPILSAIIGIGFNFCWLSMIVIIIWLRQVMNTSQFIDPSALSAGELQQLEEIRLATRSRPRNTEVEKTQETTPQRRPRTVGISKGDQTGIENLSAHYAPEEIQHLSLSARDTPSSSKQIPLSEVLRSSKNIRETESDENIEKEISEISRRPLPESTSDEEYVPDLRKRKLPKILENVPT